MSRFVVGRVAALVFAENQAPALATHQHFVFGHVEATLRHGFFAVARRLQRRLVHEVFEVGAGKPGRAFGEHLQVHIVGQRDLARMHAENSFASADVGARNDDAPVEAARTQ